MSGVKELVPYFLYISSQINGNHDMYDSHVDTHHLWSCGVHQLRNNTSPSIHLKTFKSKDYVLVEKNQKHLLKVTC